jgi:hypothetical protein
MVPGVDAVSENVSENTEELTSEHNQPKARSGEEQEQAEGASLLALVPATGCHCSEGGEKTRPAPLGVSVTSAIGSAVTFTTNGPASEAYAAQIQDPE